MIAHKFEHLKLCKPILRALADEGYEEPTRIQTEAIPQVMTGRDLLATAQTGTGKTAAFALPILHRLHETHGPKAIRVLILTPTRELAQQIDASFRAYGRYLSMATAVTVGGVSKAPQLKALKRRPRVLVATPGRLLDLRNDGHVNLDHIEILVIDEADRMLDMGFIRDVRRIVSKLPKARQTLMFSATLPAAIAEFASDMLRDPSMVEVTPTASISDNIAQKVLFVERRDKNALLTHILSNDTVERALVFTRTKHKADFIMRQLALAGVSVRAIHSDKPQIAREKALAAFDRGRIKVLVATDIVARGIDVEGISHVINYELPNDPESYVHRIGRTARAGAIGTALSFCDFEEVPMLEGIERLTRSPLSTVDDHPYHAASIAGLSRRHLSKSNGSAKARMRQRMRPRGRRRR